MSETILMHDIIKMLLDKRGNRTATEQAAEIGVSVSYLGRVINGRDDPGPAVLKYLGLYKLRTENLYAAIKDHPSQEALR